MYCSACYKDYMACLTCGARDKMTRATASARARAHMHVSHAVRMLIACFKVPRSSTYLYESGAPPPRPARCMRAPENPAPRPSPACAWLPATPGGVAGGGCSDPGRGLPPPTPGPNIPGRRAWGMRGWVLSLFARGGQVRTCDHLKTALGARLCDFRKVLSA